MERSDLELVCAIRAQGSLAGAARVLQVAPPAVSKRLAALEAQLGLRLFLRTTRRVSPTAEGEALCEQATRLLGAFQAVEESLREQRREPAGSIRLAATFGFGRHWLGPALAEFQSRHPAVTVQLHLTEQLPDLAVEGYDGAIWLWNAPQRRAGEWMARRLARNQRVLVAAPHYLQSRGAPAQPEDLARHDCLAVRENVHPSNPRFDEWRLVHDSSGRQASVAVQGPLSSNSGEMVRDWCLAGHGIMLRSLWDVAPRLAAGDLVRVLPAWSMPDADVHWLAPYRPQTPRRIRLLVDFLAQRFEAEPWKLSPPASARAPRGSRRTP